MRGSGLNLGFGLCKGVGFSRTPQGHFNRVLIVLCVDTWGRIEGSGGSLGRARGIGAHGFTSVQGFRFGNVSAKLYDDSFRRVPKKVVQGSSMTFT